MSQELFLLTWSREPWTRLELGHTENSSVLTTLSLARAVQETIGPKDITLRERSWSTMFWMLFEKRLRVVIVFKAFN